MSVVSTVAVVPSPFTKFTVSYAFTKSFASPFPCKFHPAFNTSPTVAALFLISSTLLGEAALVVGEFVSFLAPSKFPAIFFNVVGFLVPSGPFTDVITSDAGTSSPVPSGFA